MKIYLVILFCLATFAAPAQGYFEEKYDECTEIKRCQYCGDTLPQPPFNFEDKIIRKIATNPWGYHSVRPGKLSVELLIDSTGHPCIVSIDDQLFSYEMKNDVIEAINDMALWKPARLGGKPINAAVVVQFVVGERTYNFRLLNRKEVPIKKGDQQL